MMVGLSLDGSRWFREESEKDNEIQSKLWPGLFVLLVDLTGGRPWPMEIRNPCLTNPLHVLTMKCSALADIMEGVACAEH